VHNCNLKTLQQSGCSVSTCGLMIDDWYWVRDLTAPMHLGHINRPFVPPLVARYQWKF